jgi:hypothetical protein
MTITNVSTDELFNGTFQQKILVVVKWLNNTQTENTKLKRSHTTIFDILKISQVFHITIENWEHALLKWQVFPVNIIGQHFISCRYHWTVFYFPPKLTPFKLFTLWRTITYIQKLCIYRQNHINLRFGVVQLQKNIKISLKNTVM